MTTMKYFTSELITTYTMFAKNSKKSKIIANNKSISILLNRFTFIIINIYTRNN